MLSFRTQGRLANLLYAIAESEKKTEVVREVLAEQRSFQTYTAFRRIDADRKGYISASDVIDFLADNNVIASTREALVLFNFFDSNADNRITYAEFARKILPNEDKRLRHITSLRDSYYLEPFSALPYEVEWALARVFDQEIKNHRNVQMLKEILISSHDFSNVEAFNSIDIDQLGYLDYESINFFMKSNHKALSPDEILALFRRVGSEELERISYRDFVNAISPNSKSISSSSLPRTLNHSSSQKLLSSSTRSFYTPKKKGGLRDSQDEEYLRYVQDSARSKRLLDLQRELNNSRINMLSNSYSSNRKFGETSLSGSQFLGSSYNTPSKLSRSNKFNNSSLSPARSPMRGNEEEHLVQALKQHIVLDREIEDIKKQLALKSDFNLLDAFKEFDQKGSGFVSRLDLELSLNDIGIFPTRDELYLLFKRADSDGDGYLRYGEFVQIITPQTPEYASLMSNRSPDYNNPAPGINNFSFDTQLIFKNLINRLMEGQVQAQALRQKLARRPLFSIHDAFTAIDELDRGFITLQDFQSILQENGIFVSQNDLLGLVKRFDQNQDGKVSYSEFLNEMTPKSASQY